MIFLVVFCYNLVYNFLLLHVQFYSFFYSLVCDFLFSRVQFCVFLQFGVCDFVFFVAISCVNFFFPIIQSSKCHVFVVVVYCFLIDSFKIFRKKIMVVF